MNRLLLAVCMIGLVIPTKSMAAAEMDAKSKEVLEKLSTYVQGLKSVQVDLVLTMNIKAQGVDQEMVTDQTVSIQKPNKMAMVLTEGMGGSDLYSDGKDMVTYLPMTKKYLIEDAPESFNDMSPTSMIGLQLMGLPAPGIVSHLWSDDPLAALTEHAETVTYLGTTEMNEQPYHKLEMVLETADMEIWISDSDKPVIHRIVPDMEKTIAEIKKEKGPQLGEIELKVNIDVKDWKYNPDLSADIFTFTPPAGVSLASTQNELLGRGQRPSQQPDSSGLVGKPAANFTLELLDGGQFELANEKGESIVILDFFATWCGPCRQIMPSLEALAEEYRDKNVKLIAVNLGETRAQIKSFLSDQGIHPTVVLDKSGRTANDYMVRGIPQTVIVGKDGTVQAVHVGAVPGLKGVMARQLDTLLSGKSLAN